MHEVINDMSKLELYLHIKETGERVPLFPMLTNEQVASIYQQRDRGNIWRAFEDLEKMTGCSDLETKRFFQCAHSRKKSHG